MHAQTEKGIGKLGQQFSNNSTQWWGVLYSPTTMRTPSNIWKSP